MFLKALNSLCHVCNEFKQDGIGVQLANVSGQHFCNCVLKWLCYFGVCVCVCVSESVCVHVSQCVCVCVCVCVSSNVCVHTCMCICVCAHVCVCACFCMCTCFRAFFLEQLDIQELLPTPHGTKTGGHVLPAVYHTVGLSFSSAATWLILNT